MSRFLSSEGDNAVRLVNNLDWTAGLSAIDFLRDIGKHYRVGTMLKKDAVASRLNSDAGISYTEFSYQILQGFDYLELYRQYDCVLQTGGSDQWGNLTSGTDLIHRVEGRSVHAIGTPLITNSDGTKFGKSEGNAIWLDAAMCSPYRFYQFWLNTDDADVIEPPQGLHVPQSGAHRAARRARRERAVPPRGAARARAEVTTLVHGADATAAVIAASQALFGQGDLGALDPDTLESALARAAEHDDVAGCPDRAAARRHRSRREPERGPARHRPGRRLARQRPRSTTRPRRSRDASPRGGMAVLRRGKKTLAGVFVE